MSEVHLQHVDLSHLIAHSDLIAVAKKDEPFISAQEIAADYTIYRSHYIVTEVLYANSSLIIDRPEEAELNFARIKAGHKLSVLPASHFDQLYLWQNNLHKSPIYPHYQCKACSQSDTQQIIFVRKTEENELIFAALDAIEGVSEKTTVVDMLRKQQQ